MSPPFQSPSSPRPPSLLQLFFLRETNLVDREQGRYAQKASAGKELAQEILPCFRKVRRAYRAPRRAPYIGITLFLRKELLARPTQKTQGASWFLRVTPLLPGRATPEIQSIFRLLGEK